MTMHCRSLALPLLLWPCVSGAAEPRPLRVDDLLALKDVADPRISPEGRWVAFTVTTVLPKEDEVDTDVYMVPFLGGDAVRLTASPKPETSPRFSPDGRYLAFLSDRAGKKTQVWLLNRSGGEAVKLTDYQASVSDLAWSPDSTRLVLVVSDPDPDDPEAEGTEAHAGQKSKTPKPIVIRRRQFMRDGEGYLGELRKHLFVFDVQKKTSVQVTAGPYDDDEPVWSPDGQTLAFTSNRTPDPDSNQNTDIFLVAAAGGGTPRALTTWAGSDSSPAFSPDGKWIVYVAGGDPKDLWYGTSHVALVATSGGASRPLTASLDRNVLAPRFGPDGKSVLFILEDGGNKHLCRIGIDGGGFERLAAGERDVMAFDVGPKGELAVLESVPERPAEVSALVGGALKRITAVNDAALQGIRLGRVERFKAQSADGTLVDGFLTRPPGASKDARLPTILRIHGGPADQFSTEFHFEWQVLAAQGYAVVAANPRGSVGYGTAFSRAIFADWGNKDFDDVMAAVDRAISMGVADPDRLGVGGWSYGGILTDHVITKTTRFKAAISGASEANYLAGYGTDHYQYEWELELGLPWRNTDLWLRLSPWFKVERVRTPTLILGGAADLNVPLLNSEQLYQALKRLGVETELVVYPAQPHSIGKPSYRQDRLERYIAWYDAHLKPRSAARDPGPAPGASVR